MQAQTSPLGNSVMAFLLPIVSQAYAVTLLSTSWTHASLACVVSLGLPCMQDSPEAEHAATSPKAAAFPAPGGLHIGAHKGYPAAPSIPILLA